MGKAVKKAICLLLTIQVGLVGAFGFGLHSLLGCEHGPRRADGVCETAHACGDSHACCGCDSPFHRRCQELFRSDAESNQDAASQDGAVLASGDASENGCLGGCSVCDLLKQYHSAAQSEAAPLLFSADCFPHRFEVVAVDANVSTRLADPRGPPASLPA